MAGRVASMAGALLALGVVVNAADKFPALSASVMLIGIVAD